MGKTKQVKEKKFDRNVEISAPILDPEIIKAIHSPPKGQKIDIRHGGFKALLSDLNSQDSMDEFTPITDNHVPSYIGISCAVSGYSGYSSYSNNNNNNNNNSKPLENITNTRTTRLATTPNRSQTSSPISSAHREHHVRHITIDKKSIKSPDDERIKLTEELTASATERRRSPSPLLPPEDERHHGAYVGARYFPMPPPSKLVNKHIPLLGIDDDQDPDLAPPDDANKVEKKIATLYGDNFVEDWKESMSHKAKKEHLAEGDQNNEHSSKKSPKDLVTLKPTPKVAPKSEPKVEVEVPAPNVKVLAGVEKQFLNRLLTDENPPMPKSPPQTSPVSSPKTVKTSAKPTAQNLSDPISPKQSASPVHQDQRQRSPSPPPAVPAAPTESPEPSAVVQPAADTKNSTPRDSPAPPTPTREANGESDEDDDYDDQHSQSPQPPMSPDSGKNQSINEEAAVAAPTASEEAQSVEEHIEYEIRAQSPVDNQASPVRVAVGAVGTPVASQDSSLESEKPLVSFSPEPSLVSASGESQSISQEARHEAEEVTADKPVEVTNQTLLLDLMDNDEPQSMLAPTNDDDDDEESPESKLAEQLVATTLMTTTSGGEKEDDKVDQTSTGAAGDGDNNNKGSYYLLLLDEESSFILGQVQRAETILAEREHQLDEDDVGRIRSAIGKANLLINKKCNQFRELCVKSMKGDANEQYAVLNDDLAGFWDMLSIQFSDVRRSFEKI